VAAWFARLRAPTLSALAPSAAYALWAPTYPSVPHNALMRVEQAAMVKLLPDVAGRIVLDAACGTGRYLRVLEARGAARRIGVDLTSDMLVRAQPIRANLVVGDICAVPLLSASVDVVVSGLALNDVEALDRAVSELVRVLRPGGYLVYSVVHPRGGPLGWTRSFETPDGPRAVVSHWHTRADHERACTRAGLSIEAAVEPRLPAGITNPPDGPIAIVIRAVKKA
jgi:malonyl-CoA O-methyltransferase